MKKLTYAVVTAFLFLVGCRTDVTVEVYSSDLRTVATDDTAKLTAATLMAIQIPSADKCAEYTPQIVEIMKGLVDDFKPQGCKQEQMDSFLVAEIQSPLVPSMEAWEKSDALFGVAVLAHRETVAITLNRKKYAVLNKRMNDKFHQTLDLPKSKITMILHNDERGLQTYGVRGAFVNGAPMYEPQNVDVKRRGKATILLSNVGSASLAKHGYVIVLGLKKG